MSVNDCMYLLVWTTFNLSIHTPHHTPHHAHTTHTHHTHHTHTHTHTTHTHTHTHTQVAHIVSLVVLSVLHMHSEITAPAATVGANCTTYYVTDLYAAYFCMTHVGLWGVVAIFDRIIQWRHRALRRKGYLKFYHSMRNIRRIPFLVFSLGTCVYRRGCLWEGCGLPMGGCA